MQKSIYSLVWLLFILTSCTFSKPIIPSIATEKNQCLPNTENKQQGAKSDIDIIKGWNPAQRQYFIDNYVYKSIEIRNDTLVIVK